MENNGLAQIVCENVKNLLLFKQGKEMALEARRKDAKIGKGTVDRILKGTANLDAKSLEKLSKRFNVEPWQFFIPGFDPANPRLLHEEAERRRVWNEAEKNRLASNEESAQHSKKPINPRRNAA